MKEKDEFYTDGWLLAAAKISIEEGNFERFNRIIEKYPRILDLLEKEQEEFFEQFPLEEEIEFISPEVSLEKFKQRLSKDRVLDNFL